VRQSIHFVVLAFFVATLSAGLVANCTGQPELAKRWVFIRRTLQTDADVKDIRNIVQRASHAGYNGVVLECAFDWIWQHPPKYFDRLASIKDACDSAGLEIIPAVLTVNGRSALARDKNLSSAVPVENVPFVVRDGEARVVGDNLVVNGDLEHYEGDKIDGYTHQDDPGQVSFVDRDIHRSGGTSLRFERFDTRDGLGRIVGIVEVEPSRTYRFSCWMKTDSIPQSTRLVLHVRSLDDRVLMHTFADIKPTEDWQRVTTAFNSLEYTKVKIYAGVWNGTTGRLWIDDLRVAAAGLANIVRRSGTPVIVTGASGTVYQEGDDYERITDPIMDFRYDRDDPPIRIASGSRIQEGEQLTIDYYQAMATHGIPTACPSLPEFYDIKAEVIERVHEVLRPHGYLINTSEVRGGGWCQTCTERNVSPAEIMGSCYAKQAELIRTVEPDADIYVWSDMLDPEHNAIPEYFLYRGDLTGSWDFIPKDLKIVCWGSVPGKHTVQHFDKLGFELIAAAYYDADSADNVESWLVQLAKTPQAIGIMYTTWRDQYDFLETFAEIVENRSGKN